jgi:hypothetical protein
MTNSDVEFMAQPATIGDCDSCNKYGNRIKIESISTGADLCLICFTKNSTFEWKWQEKENLYSLPIFVHLFALWIVLIALI